MKFGSLFSGIGGFDLGFEQAGMECAWQCEIDKAARSVLATHWPGVPCYEDIRDVGRRNTPAVDLICGGFPCQDLSVAGKRAGLAGERSGLYWQMRRVVRELKPQWVIIENVPGLLSSNAGNDFAVVVRGLAKCGYRLAWRVFDAQFFGVAQRRRRVFIVGSLGDGRSAEVLFERDGMFGHPPARRAAGQGVAATIESRTRGGGFPGTDGAIGGHVVPAYGAPQTFDWQAGVATGKDRTEILDPPGRTRSLSSSRTLAVFGGNNTAGPIEIAAAVNAKGGSGRMDFESETFVFEPRYARNGRGAPDTIAPPLKAQNGGTGKGDGAPDTIAPPLKAQNGGTGKGDGAPVVVTAMHETGQGFWQEGDIAGTIRAEGENRPTRPSNVVAWHGAQITSSANRGGVHEEMSPTLNGDSRLSIASVAPTLSKESYSPGKSSSGQQLDWAVGTTSGVRRLTPTECERLQGFPDGWTANQSDSARYRQLGNAVAVPVIRWIGERIMRHD